MPKTINITWENVEECIDVIHNQIDETNINYIVALTRGGWIPAVLLSQKTGIKPLPFDIHVTKDDSANSEMHKPVLGHNIDFTIVKNKNLLILDDIADSGISLDRARRELEKFKPANIKTAACYINTERFKSEFKKPDVIGKPTTDWIVFPWEQTAQKLKTVKPNTTIATQILS